MAERRLPRDAATHKGLLRRLEDCEFERVYDPRDRRFVQFALPAVLRLAVAALAAGACSLTTVETRSEEIKAQLCSWFGLDKRVSDNAFGEVIRRLDWRPLRDALYRSVFASLARKNLAASRLALNTVAIDGHHAATIPEYHLRRLVKDNERSPMSAAELKIRAAAKFPLLQLQDGAGGVVGLVRAHNAVLISSEAAVVICQQPIAGNCNEMGTILPTLRELFTTYGKTGLLKVIVNDAGNTCLAAADFIRSQTAHYFVRVTEPQGDIYTEAIRTLAHLDIKRAIRVEVEQTNGKTIIHRLWLEQLPTGHLRWGHARQLVRIQRTTADNHGNTTEGERYWVCSLKPTSMDPAAIMKIARGYWRIENEYHWTADAEWDEDARRSPWSMHPDGILNVMVLRAIAINIAALLRSMSRLRAPPPSIRVVKSVELADQDAPPDQAKPATKWVLATWQHVRDTVRGLLFDVQLDTSRFDEVDACA